MKILAFRSIRTQIMTSTTLLILGLIAAIVTVWAKSDSTLYRQEKLNDAKITARVLSSTYSNELSEENWSQIRINLHLLMQENQDVVYVFVSDNRLDNQIVAGSPPEFVSQYIPDIVPLNITKQAIYSSNIQVRVSETFLLTDIYFGEKLRGKRGERVIEVASDILGLSQQKLGTLRIGISLKRVDIAVRNTVNKALMVGFIGLNIGLVCAYILAHRLSDPVRRLQMSVAKIANGDLQHRADIYGRGDEIGALAISVNEMSRALQISFSKLQKTLESFERFVPNKFVSVISPQGIENIEVGMAAMRKMTILFCDIRSYTSMSEAMTPMEIFLFLNDYLACMGKAIDESGGFIDKYIGDAIMALFDDQATDGALKAALLMQKSLDQFNHERSHHGLPKIAVGIGIHRGEVVMGTVGFTCRIDSTVVGDSVNIASRVENITKYHDCRILVTDAVIFSLSQPELFSLRLVDQYVKLRGKDEAIAIYEVEDKIIYEKP
ncbi:MULTISPECIES: adenylate/guanylate cyclase domain-containing protein [unclassified Nodularia (in: cyanobacteria)]|uniref:adenylate/guanylate cyclase domain-containing protein n=1 Tax=unclassified Nodularia (in: cyanobacteria) TaxID=2656917 RepID=UPI00187F0928|nr:MULTISPECIES: adenylate/guanylate cyclase domain-containing protein [unclassified Nodularia (in: cyanobacteria)]MBE9199564.1 HAMP domain-containing protein [Nodularia sp. LEGE 06071]MCC2691377.1 HAMP domain-containing protein [Nodularia sp. LEGE 04288]